MKEVLAGSGVEIFNEPEWEYLAALYFHVFLVHHWQM